MIAQSVAIFFTIIIDFGFNISATRQVSKLRNNKRKLSKFFWNIIIIKTGLIFLSFITLFLLTLLVPKFKLNPLVYLFSFGYVLGQAIFPTWIFQGIEKMKIITFINIIAKTFFTATIFLFILTPEDFLLVPILNGLGFIISGIIGFIYSLKFIDFYKPSFAKSILIIKESFSLLISNLAVSLYTSSNVLILGFFGGDVIAGVYASIEKLIIAFKSIYIPLYQAIFPNLSKKNYKEINNFIKKLIIPVTTLGVSISLIIFFQAKRILDFVFNDELISSYYYVFKIVGLIATFSALNMLFVTLYFPAIKKYNIRVKILVFSGTIHIIQAIILAKFYSIIGVAIAAVFTELLILLYSYIIFKKNND
jgi:PST family polysaccharide transporter